MDHVQAISSNFSFRDAELRDLVVLDLDSEGCHVADRGWDTQDGNVDYKSSWGYVNDPAIGIWHVIGVELCLGQIRAFAKV